LIISQFFNWIFKSKPRKEKIKEFDYALIILPCIIIWGLLLLLLKSEWKINGFQNMLYLAKVISIIWLVLLPMKDYWKWASETALKNPTYLFPFAIMMFISIVYVLGPFVALNNQWWSNYFLDDNRFFFGHTIFTLAILFWSDYLIKDYVEKENPSYSEEIEKLEKTLVLLENNNDQTVIEFHHKRLLSIKIQKDDCELNLLRYEVTIRYADKAILFSLAFTYCLYWLLFPVFNILQNEKALYESFFEGAQIFSLIISTAIYFLIVKKYGHKTVHNN